MLSYAQHLHVPHFVWLYIVSLGSDVKHLALLIMSLLSWHLKVKGDINPHSDRRVTTSFICTCFTCTYSAVHKLLTMKKKEINIIAI